MPQPWRAVGPQIPTGAATSAIRDVAYFPAASIARPVLMIAVWLVAGAAVALVPGHRRSALTEREAEASPAAAAAP